MSAVTLDDIRPCLEGIIPSMIATCAPDGTPNVAYLSQVYYADPRHVALSFQFFNKTRKNILAHPHATLLLHPQTSAYYRLQIRYLRTQTEGPLFESMRAQLAGIASHSGMADVFELKGSDIYEVLAIEAVPGTALPAPPPRPGLLGQVRRCSEQLARCSTLDEALELAARSAGLHIDAQPAPAGAQGHGAGTSLHDHDPHQAAQDRRGHRAQHAPRAGAAGSEPPDEAALPHGRPGAGALNPTECCPRHADKQRG